MTEKLYLRDPYLDETEATIRAKDFSGGVFRIRLDRTIFSPEGGGQPRDTGTINGSEVLDLAAEEDEIVHVTREDPGSGPVRLRIDSARRREIMRQHTGQHLLSQALEKLFGIRTLSFSITQEHASIELDRPSITAEEIERTEQECQRIILENRPIKIFESDDPGRLKLRKPPKVEGRIRVVEIDGYDRSACGGTHVRSSGEIGMVKIIRTDRVRSNVRIYYAAGFRALRDCQLKHALVSRIQQQITLPLPEIPAGIENLITERDQALRRIRILQRQRIEEKIHRCAELPEALVAMDLSGFDTPEIKYFAANLAKRGKHAVAYSRTPTPYMVVVRASGTVDLRTLSGDIFALLSGKGGGRESMLEGKPGDFSRLDEAIRRIREKLGPPPP